MGISAVVGKLKRGGNRGFTGIFGRMISSSRSSSVEKAVSPWLTLRPQCDRGHEVFRFYNLEDQSEVKLREVGEFECSKIVGSAYGWLTSLEMSEGLLFLSDPVSGRQVELPPVTTLPDSHLFVSRVVVSDDQTLAFMIYGRYRSLAYCIPGHSHSWSLMRSPSPSPSRYEDFVEKSRLYENIVYSSRRKTLFSLSTVCYTNEYCPNPDGFTSAELESWDLTVPNSPPTARVILGPDFNFEFTDDFKLLDFDSERYQWPARSEEASRLKRFQCLKFKYLAVDEAHDHLFLVVRHVIPRMHTDGSLRQSLFYSEYRGWDCNYAHKTIDFDVYKIDVEGKVMSHMEESLDGLALFVGLNHPFVVRPAPNSRLKPNSIYFTDLPEHLSWYYNFHDNGVFDYASKTFSACHKSYPVDVRKVKPKRRSINQIISDPLPFWYTPIEQ